MADVRGDKFQMLLNKLAETDHVGERKKIEGQAYEALREENRRFDRSVKAYQFFGLKKDEFYRVLRQYVPDVYRRHLNNLHREANEKIYKAITWVFPGYLENERRMVEAMDEYLKLKDGIGSGNPARADKFRERFEDVKRELSDLSMKRADYRQYLENIFNDLAAKKEEFAGIVNHYTKRPSEGKTNSSHLLVAVLTAVFGASVIYALANIRPEQVSTGAFVGGSSGTFGVMVMVATVILFLFMVTHKKLESA